MGKRSKLTLGNFESEVDKIIVNRGLEYFEDGLVVDLEKLTDTQWKAIVEGTDLYKVETTLDGDTILDWSCDCPFDMGPLCKHVVAVWYEIRDHWLTEEDQSVEKSRSDKIEELLKNVSEDEIRVFMKKQLQKNDALFQKFYLTFQKNSEYPSANDYIKQIQTLVYEASAHDGFINYRRSIDLMEDLYELLEQAEDFAGQDRFEEALNICQAILMKIPEILQQMDDSAGMSAEIFEHTCELIEGITDQLRPQKLRDQLFIFLDQEFPKTKYHDWDFHLKFLDIMESLLDDEDKERRYIELLDKAIQESRSSTLPEISMEPLLLRKIDFYRRKGQSEKAQEILENNAELSGIRKILVNQHLQRKDYVEAEKMILEGIALGRKKGWPGIVNEWKQELLKLHEKTGNQKKIRKLAEELFFSGLYDITYYHKLKSTYPADQWKNEWPEIVTKMISRTPSAIYDVFMVARIYLEEEQKIKLLELLQKHSENLHLLEDFYQFLIDEYPRQILELFRQGVDHLVQEAGRKNYVNALGYLKMMQKMQNGKTVVSEMVKIYRQRYINRPAMMEVLDRLSL